LVYLHLNPVTSGSSKVPFHPQIELEPLEIPAEWFLASLRFQQWGKLDQLGIELDSIDY